jgi:hypothetical protein
MTANSGVARDTVVTDAAWVTTYSYNAGAGKLAGFSITLETSESDWLIKLTIDGEEIFGSAGIKTEDLEKNDRYGFDADTSRNLCETLGLNFRGDRISFSAPYFPVQFASSISVSIKRVTGAATKKFKHGLVLVQKGL